MKSLKCIPAFLMFVALMCGARTIDEIPNVHVADRTRFVSDPDGYLSPAALATADSMLSNIWQASTAEAVAVVVKDMSGGDIDSYATALFDKWKIGKNDKDNGVLLLVSVDDRKGVIRTGYGAEGVLPDIICGRILRNELFPNMKNGDTDAAIIGTIAAIGDRIGDPEAIEELKSAMANDAGARNNRGENLGGFFRGWLTAGAVFFVLMLAATLWVYFRSRGDERHKRYGNLKKLSMPMLILTVAFLGVPILAYLLLRLLMKKVRRSVPACPNCAHSMRLIDEVHDNDYLTPAQDAEEKLGSVDYDVWHCDNCNGNEVIPYINTHAPYGVCPNCGARAEQALSNTVVRQPTTSQEGVGAKNFCCRNCQNRRQQLYRIAKIVTPPVFIGGGGFGRGGGGGFGGFGGGSFGGGMTGGGGASGGW